MHGQVHGQVHDQVHGQVRGQVHGQVDGQVDGQVRDQVHGQVDDQVDGQVHGQVDGQVRGQVRGQVHGQVRDQVHGQVDGQVHGQVDGQVHGQVHGQVDGQVHGQVDGQVRDQVHGRLVQWWESVLYGQHWAGYYSYFAVMEAIGVTGIEPIHGQQLVARSAGWWWAHRDFAVITERPSQLHRDAAGEIHSATGAAITYPDGWGFWCWHGRRVPAWVIEQPTVEAIAAEANVEVRRCAIESMGWNVFAQEAELKLVSRAPDPGNAPHYVELYDVPERLWGSRVRMMLVTNGTPELDGSYRRFGVTVDAAVSSAAAAPAWSYDDPSHPVRVTPEMYAQIARRT